MDESRAKWRQYHSHESSILNHGTYGTATYHADARSWIFGAEDEVVELLDEVTFDGSHGQQCRLLLISDPEVLVEPSRALKSNTAGTAHVLPISSELAYALTVVDIKSDPDKVLPASGALLDTGAAVWLSRDGVDSGNLTLPLTVYVKGENNDALELTCHSRNNYRHTDLDGRNFHGQIPHLIGDITASWSNFESIFQVLFSSRGAAGSENTYLAVRHLSGTSIFQPTFGRADLDTNTSSDLRPNHLLTFDTVVTGGNLHSDVAFSTRDHHRVAIIDCEGNWSTWNIAGQRGHTAKVAHRATLLFSGNLFSWHTTKRPADIGLFFDGWHKVLWVSTGVEQSESLLVCNRRDLVLLDSQGNLIYDIDLRLNFTQTGSQILDIGVLPQTNLCVVLTTHKLLLFDLRRSDWKGVKGPALVSAWQHNYDPRDTSLRFASVDVADHIMLVLYSCVSIRTMLYTVSTRRYGDTMVACKPSQIRLPHLVPDASLASMFIYTCETFVAKARTQPDQLLLQIVLQYDDLSVSKILATFIPIEIPEPSMKPFDLLLPPQSVRLSKSERFVDSIDDEYDLVNFISSHLETPELKHNAYSIDQYLTNVPKATHRMVKDLSLVLNTTQSSRSHSEAHPERSVLEAFASIREGLPERLGLSSAGKVILLIDLLGANLNVDDIENDSAHIEQIVHVSKSGSPNSLNIEHCGAEPQQSLFDLYGGLFSLYIGQLSSNITDRTRVQREKLIRNLSVDLHLSNMVVRIPEHSEHAEKTTANLPAGSQILSEPLMAIYEHPDSLLSPVSASQPQYQSDHDLNHKPSVELLETSTLQAALKRLSIYVSLPYALTAGIDEDGHTSGNIDAILQHIPHDTLTHPDDYSWQSTELSISANSSQKVDTNKHGEAHRRREKLSRARKRAEMLSLGFGVTDLGPQAVPHVTSEQQVIFKDLAGTSKPHTEANDSANSLVYDGRRAKREFTSSQGSGAGTGSQKQVAMRDVVSATQPVSGAFAIRSNMGTLNRIKKKRRAGF